MSGDLNEARSNLRGIYLDKEESSGIENVAVDANAPVEFYNLQGVRVDEPANGIFIRRQGNKAVKVLVK